MMVGDSIMEPLEDLRMLVACGPPEDSVDRSKGMNVREK
jgi:hypothetical protein